MVQVVVQVMVQVIVQVMVQVVIQAATDVNRPHRPARLPNSHAGRIPAC
jgi:hypothetical protein